MQSNNLSTIDEISSYRLSHPGTCLIIDTNILFLFFIGSFDSNYLKECPLMTDNGKNYGKEHFELMKKILSLFLNKITITPHILSEVNMLSRKRIKPELKMKNCFKEIIVCLKACEEKHVEMKMILENDSVIKFGFTDVSLVEVAKMNIGVILTDEFDLYQTYREQIPIISFNQIVANEQLKQEK